MSLMGYTETDVNTMAQTLLESAVVLRDIHNHDKLVTGLLEVWNFLDGMLEEGRI
jgi:hypothetical protein